MGIAVRRIFSSIINVSTALVVAIAGVLVIPPPARAHAETSPLPLNRVAYIYNGATATTTCNGGGTLGLQSLEVADINGGTHAETLYQHDRQFCYSIHGPVINHARTDIVFSSGQSLLVVNIATKQMRFLPNATGACGSYYWTADDSQIFCMTYAFNIAAIKYYNSTTGALVKTISLGTSILPNGMALLPSGDYLVTGFVNQTTPSCFNITSPTGVWRVTPTGSISVVVPAVCGPSQSETKFTGLNLAPDASRFTYISYNQFNGATRLRMINADGTNDHMLSDLGDTTTSFWGGLTWTMDSQELVGGYVANGVAHGIRLSPNTGQIIQEFNPLPRSGIGSITAGQFSDNGAPRVIAQPVRPPDANGWYNHSITINWQAVSSADAPTQPAASTAVSPTLGTDVVSGQSCNSIGCSTGSLPVSLDNFGPSMNVIPSPSANGNGWNNTNVTVSFSCSDGFSGVQFCPSPVVVSNDTASQVVSGTSTDWAGNSTSGSRTIKFDKTKPIITPTLNPSANGNGWNNTNVTVSFACSDALSGIATCIGGPQTITGETSGTIVSGTATDKAGNTQTASATVKVDKTTPTIGYHLSQAPNGAGWNNNDVTVTFDCADALSGIASCSAPVTLGEGAHQTVTGTATDAAGNTKAVSVTLNIDEGKPIVAYAITAAPNAAGWNNANTTVSFTCMDSLSGIASCPSNQTVTTEGSDNAVSGTATDVAGNSQTVSTTIKLDKTTPNISYHLSEQPNANDWHKNDVVVTFDCDDALSGVASCTAPITVTDGANQTVSGTAIDVAGNTKSVSVTLNVDKGEPTIVSHASPTANAAGWNKDDVTVSFDCNDALSGIDSCTSPQIVSTETAGQVVTGTAADKAGNTKSTSQTIKLDKTDPTINYHVSAPANGNGWNNQDVTVTFDCGDNLSGVASCSAPVTLGEGQNQAVTGTATDVAGNTKSISLTLNVDKGLPTITSSVSPAANAAGWHNADTTVTFTCDDALSGVDNCTAPQTVTSDTDGMVISGQALDKAGNIATATETVKLDKTAPTIAYALSQDPNGAGWNNGDVTVTFTCNDNLSGVSNCSDPVTLHEGANQTVTGTATDVAGNVKTVAVTLNVDKTAPTITSVISPAPNAAGWHKSDVLVGFNCADLLSGVASCTDPQTISAETAGQTITGNVTDVADNTASTTATVKLDKTAPTISYSLSEQPNANDWHKNDVVVTFNCADNLSGVADCTAPITLGEGVNQSVTGNVTDIAGNTNSVSLTVNIDKGLPTITSSVSPAANAAGWHNSDTTVSFACTDDLSGIDNCTAPQTITADSDGLSVTGQALDKAGNVKTATETVKLDKTVPTISYSVNHVPNVNGWNNNDVTVTFNCGDNLSGVATCSAPVTLTEGGNQTITGTATDVAGNTQTVSATINIDKTLPTISSVPLSAPNAAGWYKSDVTIGFDCSDLLSGIDSCTNNQTVNTEGASNQVTGTVVDKAGNTASTTATVKLDKTAPTIAYSLSAPPNGNGWNNSSVTVSFNCGDALSGVASCSTPVTLGEGANQSVTGTATDVAGNTKTVTVIVNVDAGKPTIAYTVSPLPNGAGWNKANATVTFTCMDSLSGIASCTSPQTVSTETASQTITGTAVDLAGNSQSVTATVKLDKTAPITSGVSLSGGVNLLLGYVGGPTTITATVSDNLSGLNRAEYYIDTDPGLGNGTAMTITGNSASITGAALATGTHTVYVRSQDIAGNWSTVTAAQYTRIL